MDVSYKKISYITAVCLCCIITSCTSGYKYSYYKINGCNLTLTVVQFSNSGHRYAAFINGAYHGDVLPENQFILKEQTSGLSASFGFVPTCNGDTIIINHNYGVFEEGKKSVYIRSKEIKYEAFDVLKSKNLYITIE